MIPVVFRAHILPIDPDSPEDRMWVSVYKKVRLPFIPPAGSLVVLKELNLAARLPEESHCGFGNLEIVLDENGKMTIEVDVDFPEEGKRYLADHPHVLEKYGWFMEERPKPRTWGDDRGAD